jgi:hypothetical protein
MATFLVINLRWARGGIRPGRWRNSPAGPSTPRSWTGWSSGA